MKVTCIQMDMMFANPDENFKKAGILVSQAADDGADVVLLPETWNTGFFPRENLNELADKDGERTKAVFSDLARKKSVNIVAGSVANCKDGSVYNTAYVFDRQGECVAEYDKTHLFSPMDEDKFFTKGDHTCTFVLDGVRCALIICYDVRFPELTRTMTVKGVDILFMVSQWPLVRVPHLDALTKARAIENQMFVACCNSAGKAGETVYGGNSSITDPWGNVIAHAVGSEQEIISANCDMGILKDIRNSINVFRDRRPELYEY
ncbi:MAG: carbon-nitrogen family hydrolase [Lachnospiraceae bacterium]|nr:carbon-nitrogen family hydrolase [Lachnospiraceae bacterium]